MTNTTTQIEIPEQPLDSAAYTTLQICIYLAVMPFGEPLTVTCGRHKGIDYAQAVRMQMSRARSKARRQNDNGTLLFEFQLKAQVDVDSVTFWKEQTLTQKMESAVKKQMLAKKVGVAENG